MLNGLSIIIFLCEELKIHCSTAVGLQIRQNYKTEFTFCHPRKKPRLFDGAFCFPMWFGKLVPAVLQFENTLIATNFLRDGFTNPKKQEL